MKTSSYKIGLGLMMALLIMVGVVPSAHGATDPPLGSTSTFAILAGAGFTNSGASTVTGNAGSSPTNTCSGFQLPCTVGPGTVTGGAIYLDTGSGFAATAQADLTTAQAAAATQGPGTLVTADLGTFNGGCGVGCYTPGVFSSASTLGLTGTMTLQGSGVYIFIAGSSITTASSSAVSLTSGASAAHVYWVTGYLSSGSVTLGTSSSFIGTILAQTSITLAGSNTLTGRALARTGAVVISTSSAIITVPGAVVPEFPIGVLVLAVPVLAIYLFMRGRGGSLGVRIRLTES